MTKLLVFSDLDGTLLDHETYSWQPAQPALDRLKAVGAGLILASSKTAAEIRPLQVDLGCDDQPAIVENGAGLLWPDQAPLSDSGDYQGLLDKIKTLPTGFVGFAAMQAQEVATLTGLSPEQAVNAKARRFSEPGLWRGPPDRLDAFLNAVRKAGLEARRGGRFLTLSLGKTKAQAMRELVDKMAPTRTIALGDAPNDVEMIDTADHGVIVANPASPPLPVLASEKAGRTIRTHKSGPAGWNEAILALTRQDPPPPKEALHG